jgi:hypothetical protein
MLWLLASVSIFDLSNRSKMKAAAPIMHGMIDDFLSFRKLKASPRMVRTKTATANGYTYDKIMQRCISNQ